MPQSEDHMYTDCRVVFVVLLIAVLGVYGHSRIDSTVADLREVQDQIQAQDRGTLLNVTEVAVKQVRTIQGLRALVDNARCVNNNLNDEQTRLETLLETNSIAIKELTDENSALQKEQERVIRERDTLKKQNEVLHESVEKLKEEVKTLKTDASK
jgi:cell division protein FtsB